MLLNLRVVPGASRDQWVRDETGIRVRVQAPAVDGKANKRLKAFVARSFGVRASRVTIERGEASRLKRLRIASPKKIPQELT